MSKESWIKKYVSLKQDYWYYKQKQIFRATVISYILNCGGETAAALHAFVEAGIVIFRRLLQIPKTSVLSLFIYSLIVF